MALSSTLLILGALLWTLQPWRGSFAPKADWEGTGVVVELLPPPSHLHATRPVIFLHHDPIAGLMDEPMTMPFLAASPQLFAGLRAGDRVAFGLQETPDALLVVSLERLRQ